jgi:hypothetical protein
VSQTAQVANANASGDVDPAPTPAARSSTAGVRSDAPQARSIRWLPSKALLIRSVLLLPLAAIPRVWAAFNDQGTFWPDEIFQSLEPGHRLAFGYGMMPWEFREGARSWLFPALFGAYWKVLSLFGVSRSETLVPLAKCLMVAIALAGIVLCMRLAEKLAGEGAATLAGALVAFFPVQLVYGARCMTEMISGPCIVLAVLLMSEPGKRRNLAAGGVAALTIFFRYQNGVLAVGLLLWLLAQRRFADAKPYAIGATAIGLAGGLLDWFTWGAPFKAFWVYVKFNIFQGRASGFGTAPFEYYAHYLWTSTGPLMALLLLGWAVAAWRERGLTAVCLAYFLVHSFVPHKELRFIMPIVPLMLTLSAIGLARMLATIRSDGWLSAVFAVMLSVIMGTEAVNETFGTMGQYTDNGGKVHSPWHAGEDINLIMQDAGEKPDLCGLIVSGVAPAWQGGYTYLHRHVPVFLHAGGYEMASANYVIAPAGQSVPGYQQVSWRQNFGLYHRDGVCKPVDQSDFNLP